WGFTLGIGDRKVFSKDTNRTTRSIREGTPGTSRSYAVLHAYDMTRRNWSMSLKAETPAFVPPGAPVTASSFAYGLHLLSSEQPKVFDEHQSDYCADMAVLWGVCREGQADALKVKFPSIGTKDVSWAAQMTINDEALKKDLWARLAALSAVDFAPALAAAVEWNRSVGGRMADQSHQVRALGVLLLDLARKSVYLPGVTRTLSFTVGDRTTVLSSNDF